MFRNVTKLVSLSFSGCDVLSMILYLYFISFFTIIYLFFNNVSDQDVSVNELVFKSVLTSHSSRGQDLVRRSQ